MQFSRNQDVSVSQDALEGALNCSVVVAEDETMIRLDMAEILSEAGATVVGTASNGREALELIAEHQPDLAVLDVKMPDMDGLEVAEQVRLNGRTAVVMVTAFSDPTLVDRAVAAGATGYVVKPFTASNLLPAVRVALARQSQISSTQDELEGVTQKLAERKILDRAKGLLSARFGMSEPDAFRWIQKESMDQRLTMAHVAQRIVEELTQQNQQQTTATEQAPADHDPAADQPAVADPHTYDGGTQY